MSIKLYSRIHGELPLTNESIDLSKDLYFPGAEVIFAKPPLKDSFFFIQQFEFVIFTVRFYCFYSTESDIITVESEHPAITFRQGIDRSHEMISKKLGSQIFHERDYNLFFDPSPSAEYPLEAGQSIAFLDVLFENNYASSLQYVFPRIEKFLRKVIEGHPVKFWPQNKVATLDVLRWQEDLQDWCYNEHKEKNEALFIVNNLVEIAIRHARYTKEKHGPVLTRKEANLMYEASEIILNSTETPPVYILAKKLGLSIKKLKADFKEIYGHPIEKHLLEYKMLYALRASMFKNATQEELATTLGYEDPEAFEKDFKKRFGFPAFTKKVR